MKNKAAAVSARRYMCQYVSPLSPASMGLFTANNAHRELLRLRRMLPRQQCIATYSSLPIGRLGHVIMSHTVATVGSNGFNKFKIFT